jgi:hypothetical protein
MKNSFSKNKLNLASQSRSQVWNDDLKQRMNTLTKVINSKLKIINGLVFRNKGRGLISTILCIVRGVRPRSSKSVVKQVSLFSFRCYRIAKPKIERGDNLEGLVNHPSPSGSILNFPWVDFIVISVLTFLILEYLYGSPSSGYLVSPFIYDIISEETETNTLEISRVIGPVAVN